MHNINEIKSLIRLLEDPSHTVADDVTAKLEEIGLDTIPYLETALVESINDVQMERIEAMLDDMRLTRLSVELNYWAEFNDSDLLAGCMAISKYCHTNLDEKHIREFFVKMIADAKAKLEGTKTHQEKIEVLNDVILSDYGFEPNRDNYTSIDNSYINRAIENRKGNPIMLSIIYLVLGEALGLPLIGINSPRHFLIAYADEIDMASNDPKSIIDGVKTYIDPFHGGVGFDTKQMDVFLQTINLKAEVKYQLIASNKDMVKRMLNNLIYGYSEMGEGDKAKRIYEIADAL